MRRTALITIVCALAAVPASADMTTVNIDFQPSGGALYSGLGMASDSGTYWNPMSIGSSSNLLASDGTTVTDIAVSTTYVRPYANPTWGNDLLVDRLIWSQGGPSDTSVPAITISGLEAGARYNIYLYAGIYGQTYIIDGVAKSLTGMGYENDQSSWTEGVQYVSFVGVNPSDGALGIDIYNTAQNNGVWPANTVVSGMQIQAVPVPAPGAMVLAMFGLSLVGAKFRRRA